MITEENDKLYVSEENASDDGINGGISVNDKDLIPIVQQKLSRANDILECVMNEIRY